MVAPNVAMIITMTGEVAPKAFVANVGGMTNGLTAIADFTYTA